MSSAAKRPLRVAPAWVGAATPTATIGDLSRVPAPDAIWAGTVRRLARTGLWALPVSAVAQGWASLAGHGTAAWLVALAGTWTGLLALVAVTGLLAGTQARRLGVAGLLIGLAGGVLLVAGAGPGADPVDAALVGSAVYGTGWLLSGLAVLRSRLLNPADGILLMLAATVVAAGRYAVDPLPTVGALLMLAAGMGIAWCGARLLSPF
jgi:Amt family ammonium transporter